MFNVRMLPADHGDCLWIEYGERKAPRKILIDAGTAHSYPLLQLRIESLPKGERHFELFVITHVDADHIGGALELLRNYKGLGVTFGDVWFNGWKHLAPDELGDKQGELVSYHLDRLGLPWNRKFAKATIVLPDDGELPQVTLDGGMSLTLLSPGQAQLDRLRDRWREMIRGAGWKPGQVRDMTGDFDEEDDLLGEEPADLLGDDGLDVNDLVKIKFVADRAVANGSSIALLAEFDGKRCLLAADAFTPVLIDSLKRLPAERRRLNALKLSHHGSRKNTSAELLRLVKCRRYLFSTNGQQFGHPNAEAVARVIKHGGASPRLFFNYHTEFTDRWDDETLMREYAFEVHFPDDEEEGILVEL